MVHERILDGTPFQVMTHQQYNTPYIFFLNLALWQAILYEGYRIPTTKTTRFFQPKNK
jgi:hypothetical protein